MKNVKVLTFNTWGIPFNSTKKARIGALSNHIKKLDVDIILLQELWELKDYNTIVKECGYPYVTEYGRFPYIGNYAGMAILSKYPIVKTEKIDYHWRGLIPDYVKAAMHSEIIVAGRKISVFNTHLTANLKVSLGNEHNLFGKIMFTSDYEEETRWDQLKTLTKHINKALRPGHAVILGGDLNCGAQYKLWYRWEDLLRIRYKDLYNTMSYTKGLPSTYKNKFAGQNQGQLDHIIGFGGAEVLKSKVIFKTTHLSDHFGVLSTVALPH
ncbi:MAG: endonuclease/exonuclease/phosphatase family protein [Candidatus Peribacteraceae bacterium]|nr:endonuclease/exonuclease/phosphatase family protein [Candidatus Peribacteraceae bacterium]